MKLTSYTNYALRSLQLAALKAPHLVRIDDVARLHGLARPHIMKIVHQLGCAGYLETRRGRGGGFRLARPADEITVGEIVRMTEGDFDVVECFNPEKNTCPLMGVCKLSNVIKKATNAFIEVLDDVTIADIASNRTQLLERLAPVNEPLKLPETPADGPRTEVES
ncbi:MAG: Rrf2 family transcriptional regulator [Paracoccaceae bacterium]|nr:Rrf2 family transcriptional regulator [Paracoccaceae bacterium]